jgi:hypothetical protein
VACGGVAASPLAGPVNPWGWKFGVTIMNAVTKKVNGLQPITNYLPSHVRALAAMAAPMPDELTDDDINEMADWYAQSQWGQLAVNSDSQEWGF